MSNLSTIKPINTKILFQFIEDVDYAFHSVSGGGIHIVEHSSSQVEKPRWGKVLAVGPEIAPDVMSVGEYILIESLGWTNGMTLENETLADKFWFTDASKVLCITEDCPKEF